MGIDQNTVPTHGWAEIGKKTYSEQIGGFSGLLAPSLIYSVCTAFIFAVGFIPHKWIWKLIFSPYFSIAILGYFSYLYFF
jgi:cyd operon protein YbgE